MTRFEMRMDPLTREVYYDVPVKGYALMQDPLLNKGNSFTLTERRDFDLIGLLPDMIGALDEQVERNYGIYRMKTTDMERYVTLIGLLDRNETAFYALLTRHIEEMLPVVYTPTVGQACLKMSHIIRRYRGLYVSPENVGNVEDLLRNVGLPNVLLIVATDGERILGLGDLGADGMGIPVGKISLYVAAGGIHPASTLSVCIDVGTDNERLLKDPLYIGQRHPRLRGDAYYQVIERFIQGLRRVFPRALLQWEDFGKDNAFTLVDRYRHRILSFNDDIQGTGAVAAAALRTAIKMKGGRLSYERIAILGFGQAGCGVANALVTMMQEDERISVEEARSRIFGIDINGLLVEGGPLQMHQKPFAQPTSAIADWPISKERAPGLADVVKHGKATVLIGLSAQPGIFNRDLLKNLAKNTNQPVLFALSNPNSVSEATPQDVFDITKGNALMATGSPYPPVKNSDGKEMHISQCNNLYVFPGVGLGAIMCQATAVTHKMFHAASCVVSEMVSGAQRREGFLLPPLSDIRRISFEVALAVAKQAREEGIGMAVSDEQLSELIKQAMWEPQYYPYRYSGKY